MVKEFLSQLGTASEIASDLEKLSKRRCTATAVYQWPYEKKIAQKWCVWVAKLAKKKRIPRDSVPEEVAEFMQ